MTADMSNINSKYDYGQGNVVVMDFRWYAPFKGVVDVVIIALVYAMYFWRLFMRLPGIINGTSGIFTTQETVNSEYIGSNYNDLY